MMRELKVKIPVHVGKITAIEGVGPKMVRTLYEELNIKTVRDLEKAVEAKKIRKVPGMGVKTENMIGKGLKFLKKGRGRLL